MSLLRLIALMAGLLFCSQAFAHASLVSSEPADGAVLDRAPAMVRLRFNEPVAPAVLRFIDSSGKQRDISIHARNETIDIDLPRELPRGTQTLSYRIISADGHPVGGTMVFSLGAPTASGGVQSSMSAALSALIWLTRIGVYIGLFFGVGGAFFHAWIARDAGKNRFVRLALSIGVLSALLSLGWQGLDLLGRPLADLSSLSVWQAALGTSLAPSMAVALAAFGLSAWAERRHMLPLRQELAAVALAGVGIALAMTGHAASAAPLWLTRPAIFFHAITAAYWIGALVPLLQLVLRRDRDLPKIMQRFSLVALWSVAILAVAGVTLAIVQVEHPSALIETAYGRLLIFKLAAFACLLGLAAFNRRRLTPAVQAGDVTAPVQLARTIRAEILLMLVILGLVAGWRFTPPPRAQISPENAGIHLHIHQDKAMSDVTLRPGRVGSNSLRIELLSGDFGPLNPIEVRVLLSQPAAGIEPIERKAARQPDGSWVISDMPVPVAGAWNVSVKVLITDFEEVELTDTLTVR